MAATEFLNALNKLKKNQGKLDGFNAPEPMESIVDTIGQVPESNQLLDGPSIQDPQDAFSLENPEVMSGLGLGAGIVANKTGGLPATSQVLSPFAQKISINDAANMANKNLPKLVGPSVGPAVPVGPNTPPNYTGNAPARAVPGTKIAVPSTQLVPTGQAPAIRSSGMPATTPVKPTAKPTINIPGTLANVGKFATTNLVKGAGLTPNPIGDSSLLGVYRNRIANGEDANMVANELGIDSDTAAFYGSYGNMPIVEQAPNEIIPRGGVRSRGTGGEQSPMAASRTGGIAESENTLKFTDVFDPAGLGESIGEAYATEKYGTGLDAEGNVTGRKYPSNTLAGQSMTLAGTGLEYLGDAAQGAKTAGKLSMVPMMAASEYVTGQDIYQGGPVETPQDPETLLSGLNEDAGITTPSEQFQDPTAVEPAIEVDPYAAGKSMVSRADGKTLIDGVEATPEQIDAYNKAAPARNKARREAEQKAYEKAAPERAEAKKAKEAEQAAAKLEASRPKRETPAERRQKEKRLKAELRRAGQEEIKQKMSEFSRTGASSGERGRYKAFLKSQLDVNIDNELKYSRKEYEDTFTSDTNAFNKANLSAAQIATQEQAAASLRANQDKMGTVEEKMKMLNALDIKDSEKRKNYAIQILGIDPDLYIEGTNENVVVEPTILGDTPPSKGDTREQKGKNYKFDGKKWNEVK